MVVRLLISSVLLLLSFASLANKTVSVVGYGAIAQNNVADARKQAIEDAKRVAIEQLFGSYISARTETRNFMLASEKIFSSTKGRIDTYDIVEEGKLDDDTFRVKIKATVDDLGLQSAVDSQLAKYNWLRKPRILLQANQSATNNPAVDAMLINKLGEQLRRIGFTVLTPGSSLAMGSSFTLQVATELNGSASDYQGMNLTSHQLVASAQLSTTDTGMVISSPSESASKAGSNQLKIAEGLADQVAKRIAQKIQLDTQVAWLSDSTQPVVLNISGNAEQVSQVISALEQWVVGIRDKTVEQADGQNTRLTLQYQGWPEQLYDQLIALAEQNNVPFSVQQLKGAFIGLASK